MIRTKSILGSILALVGVTAAGLTAHADDLVQTFNFNDATPTYNVTFNLFNSNIGVLNSVTYEFDATNVSNFSVFNLNPSPATGVDIKSVAHVDVLGPIGLYQYLSEDITAEAANYTANGFLSQVTGVTGNTTDTASVALGDLSAYQAPGGGPLAGQLVINITPGTYQGTTPPGVFGNLDSTSTTGTLKIHYNFTRVVTPEPGTWALLAASSVMGVAGIRRRRRSA